MENNATAKSLETTALEAKLMAISEATKRKPYNKLEVIKLDAEGFYKITLNYSDKTEESYIGEAASIAILLINFVLGPEANTLREWR